METLDLCGQPLDLDLTLACGQAFRWRKRDDGMWRGVVRDKLVELFVDGDTLFWRTYPTNDRALVVDYLRLSDDVNAIYAELFRLDPYLAELVERFSGLRFLRQDPTEALLSFICSAANSIPRITTAIEGLSIGFGDLICEHSESCYFSFPRPEILATTDPTVLANTESLGFRGPILKNVARQILDRGEDWLTSLRGVPLMEAKEELLTIRGVGQKIADCVCLFSLDKDEAVPVDTHVKQLAQRLWIPELTTKSVTDSAYKRIVAEFHARYGRLAGWAQQFLFYEDLMRTRALDRGLR